MKVFLSYAKNDSEIAKRLYADLEKAKFEPWDEDDIDVGQHVSLFNKEIKDSSMILLLFSANSVSKRGEFVKQQKFILKLLDEIPDSETFIIPVRLDNCELLDERLQNLKPADLFPSYENGLEKILKALHRKKADMAESSAKKDGDEIHDTKTEPPNQKESKLTGNNTVNIGKDAEGNIIISGGGNTVNINAPGKPDKNRKSSDESAPKTLSPMMYAVMSLIAFVLGMGLLFLFIFKVNDMITWGIDSKMFYVLLIPFGMSVAAFCFGAMTSYAGYQGNVLSDKLKLVGPIVGIFMTVIGGFTLVPDTSSFDITVFVHGPKGQIDLVLKNTGEVMIDLGGDRRTEKIGAKGEASFHSIPANFRNQPVSVAVIAEGFEPVKPDQKYELKSKSVYVEVKKDEVQEILKKEDFVFVPSGSFDMGCINGDTECEDNEQPQHPVSVNGFWIGKYEVTQGQWKQIMGTNPSLKCKDCPVTASWNDIRSFIFKLNKLNEKTGKKYRLPTEAEWEFACRSGGKNDRYSGGNEPEQFGWYDLNNNQDSAHPVGTKQPNALNIYDMSGNVWEWCQDEYCPDVYNCRPEERVIRGGSWQYSAVNSRCTSRRGQSPVQTSNDIGFRLVMEE